MKRLIIVRHAWAGDPDKWRGSDINRPLDERGEKEADWLAKELVKYMPDTLVSSEYLRCWQTLMPLSMRTRLMIFKFSGLNVGKDGKDILKLIKPDTTTVVCTHGDVGPKILSLLGKDEDKNEKGSYWLVTIKDDGTDYKYVEPPEYKEDKKRQ